MMHDIQKKMMSDNEECRRGAVQSLRNVVLDDSCSLLFQAMGDESWRVRKEAVDVFVASNPEQQHITSLLELFRSEDNAGQRNSAVEAVIRLGLRALQPLIGYLHDDDADVRKFVVDVMGNIRCQECVALLLGSLDDADVNVAAAAAEQLGNQGDSSVVPDLIEAIVKNSADFFRFNALAALGKLAAPAPVPPQITFLAANEILRKPVFECLGSIADESAVPLLIEGLSSRQKSCRNAALVALYRIYERSSKNIQLKIAEELQKYTGTELVLTVMDAFTATDILRGEAVLTILDLIGDVRSVDILLKAFSHDRLGERALQSIKRLCPDSMTRALSLYDDGDGAMRASICLLCGECQHPEGAGVIQKALADSLPLVRQAAAITVGKLGLTDFLPQLVALLDDGDDVCNSAAGSLQSLALLHRDDILDVAAKLSHSESSKRRRVAALLSAALGDGERLMLLVKDEDPQVRQAAVTAMRLSHLAGVESILVMALVDEDPDVRIAAAEAIGDTGSAALAETLVSALADDDVWVKCALLKSLVQLSPETGFKEIRTLFPGASGLLLITSLQLLDSYSTDEALALVTLVADHPEREIASLAREIVARHISRQDRP